MAQMSSYKNAGDALAPSKAKAYVEGARILATGPDGDGNEINLNIPIDDLRGNKTTNWNDIEGKPEFADVATSGSYNDLSDKPEQPELAPVATSGSYNDLSDKPSIPPAQVQADWNQESSSASDFIKNKPNMDEYVKGEDLSQVALTGDYDDLLHAPQGVKINGANKQFNEGYADLGTVLTEHQDVSGKAEKSEMKVEAISGDNTKKKVTLKSGLSVNVVTDHQDISGKAEKSEMKVEAISGDNTKKKVTLKSGLSVDVVVEHKTELPTEGRAEGRVLTINDSDEVIWGEAQGGSDLPEYDQYDNGKMLTVVDTSGYGDVKLQWQHPVPTYDTEDAGKILTIKNRVIEGGEVAELSWDNPQGGFASMPKESVNIGAIDGNYAQTINVNNKKYSIASGYVDHYADQVNIKMASTDYPDAIVQFNTSNTTSDLDYIDVYNGTTKLKRLYPSHTFLDSGIIEIAGYSGSTTANPVTEFFQASDTVFVRILGDTYTVLTGKCTLKVGGGE